MRIPDDTHAIGMTPITIYSYYGLHRASESQFNKVISSFTHLLAAVKDATATDLPVLARVLVYAEG